MRRTNRQLREEAALEAVRRGGPPQIVKGRGKVMTIVLTGDQLRRLARPKSPSPAEAQGEIGTEEAS